MKRTSFIASLALAGLLHTQEGQAQCDTIAALCERHLTTAYIPDGQFHRALLREDEVAEFDITFFAGSTYRMVACSGLTDGNLIFTVLDKDRNVLFTNEEYNNDPYWDLVVAGTVDATVEARLDQSKLGSGCAVLLVGIKR